MNDRHAFSYRARGARGAHHTGREAADTTTEERAATAERRDWRRPRVETIERAARLVDDKGEGEGGEERKGRIRTDKILQSTLWWKRGDDPNTLKKQAPSGNGAQQRDQRRTICVG